MREQASAVSRAIAATPGRCATKTETVRWRAPAPSLIRPNCWLPAPCAITAFVTLATAWATMRR
eukprot:6568897-Lingulodinium_polyedra.AAC.1